MLKDTTKWDPNQVKNLPPANPGHPFLKSKQINSLGMLQDKETLIIPIAGIDGQIQGCQKIFLDGSFQFHGKIADGFHVVGEEILLKSDGRAKKSTGFICTNFEDAAALYQETGNPAFVSFTTENLEAVTRIVKKRYPGARVILDKDLPMDKGIDAVKKALKNTNDRFKLVKLSDIEFKLPDYLIYKLMEVDSTACIFSPPSEAKTFFAIDASCCVATGKDFHGRPVKQGPVVFIAGEGQNGLKRRFMAWSIRHQVDLDQAPIFISTAPTGLCDADQVEFVIDVVQTMADEYGNPILIVLDTVARNFGPGDENSTKDMTTFLSGADKIRCKFRCCVMLVHHSGHADRSRGRGSMALKGGLDVEYRLEKDETGIVRVTHAKPPKDFDPPEPMAFRLNTVELPYTDEQGNAVTSAILDETEYEPPETSQGNKGRGKWQILSVEVLRKTHLKQQENLKAAGYEPDQARVTMDDWRKACLNEGMNRETWRRVKKDLSRNPDIEQDGIYVFPC